jgi:hypothetical protein
LQHSFGKLLSPLPEIEIHRYCAASGIGSHTDADAREIRFVTSLTNAWHADEGGVWIVAGDPSLRRGRRLIPPVHNTGFAFSTSPHSFHALSIRSRSCAYALTLRFRVDK